MHRAYAVRDIRRLVFGRYKKLRLSTPAHILAGEKDFVLPPAVMPGYERHADDLTVEVVPGCGHFLHEERPEVVLRAAYELFAREG
jgi:pimeloyl-ACP methyl ester carboxylesterase